MLGFAAASDVFGASLYEPCGQIDQVGNLFGATATNRDTGGYHDKIQELTLSDSGAPQGSGKVFFFEIMIRAGSGTVSPGPFNSTGIPRRSGKGRSRGL